MLIEDGVGRVEVSPSEAQTKKPWGLPEHPLHQSIDHLTLIGGPTVMDILEGTEKTVDIPEGAERVTPEQLLKILQNTYDERYVQALSGVIAAEKVLEGQTIVRSGLPLPTTRFDQIRTRLTTSRQDLQIIGQVMVEGMELGMQGYAFIDNGYEIVTDPETGIKRKDPSRAKPMFDIRKTIDYVQSQQVPQNPDLESVETQLAA